MTTKEEKLHLAIRNKDSGKLQQLLKEGADYNAWYYGTTPLLVAITTGTALTCTGFS